MKKKLYLSVCNQALLNGYASCFGNITDIDGEPIEPDHGYLVPVISEEYPALDKDTLYSFVRKNRNLLYNDTRCLLVHEHNDGNYSFSVCDLMQDKRNAIFLGLKSNKKFIFDNQTKQLSYSKR